MSFGALSATRDVPIQVIYIGKNSTDFKTQQLTLKESRQINTATGIWINIHFCLEVNCLFEIE